MTALVRARLCTSVRACYVQMGLCACACMYDYVLLRAGGAGRDEEGELEDNPVVSTQMRVACTCTRRLFLGEGGCGRVRLPKYVRACIFRCVRKETLSSANFPSLSSRK